MMLDDEKMLLYLRIILIKKEFMNIVFKAPVDGISGFSRKVRGILFALKNFKDISLFVQPIKWPTNNYSGTREDITLFIYNLCQKPLPPKEESILFQVNIGNRLTGPFVDNGVYKLAAGYTVYESSGVPKEQVEGCNKVDILFVPSHFNLKTYKDSGVRTDIHVLHEGVDTDFFHPDYKPLDTIERKFTFLSIALLTHRKGADLIIKAFLECFADNKDVQLVLRWFYHRSLFNKIKEFVNLIRAETNIKGGNICLLSTIHEALLPRLYNSAHVYLAPFRGEGWSLPIIEALACEVPVIATNWGGPTEYLNNNVATLLDYKLVGIPYDPGDYIANVGYREGHYWAEPDYEQLKKAMLDAYNNYSVYKQKAKQGREHLINNFQWKHSAQMLIDAFRAYKDNE